MIHEEHGHFTIMASKSAGGNEYTVLNDVNGQSRRFKTIEECRQFIGVDKSPGPHWAVIPLDGDGKPMHEAEIVSAPNEVAARGAAKNWFRFIGVFHIKDFQVTPHKPGG